MINQKASFTSQEFRNFFKAKKLADFGIKSYASTNFVNFQQLYCKRSIINNDERLETMNSTKYNSHVLTVFFTYQNSHITYFKYLYAHNQFLWGKMIYHFTMNQS